MAEQALANPTSVKQARWDSFLEDSNMTDFMADSYESGDGYVIRLNPLTGKKEMMIAGTHPATSVKGAKEWVQNLMEATENVVGRNRLSTHSEHHRNKFADRLIDIAQEEDVEVVYGHSRGAAIASHFPEEFTVIGIDGASSIGERRPYINLIQSRGPLGTFDNIIASGHKGNVRLKGKGFHNVSVNKGKIKEAKKKLRASQKVAREKEKIEKRLIDREEARLARVEQINRAKKKALDKRKKRVVGNKKKRSRDTKYPVSGSKKKKQRQSRM